MSLAKISQRFKVTIGTPFKAVHSCLVVKQPEPAHPKVSSLGSHKPNKTFLVYSLLEAVLYNE